MSKDKAYRIAEDKIASARLTGAKKLNLKGDWNLRRLKLTELPETLSQLTQLHSLNLADNELTTLPEWLSKLTELRALDISANKLATLPTWLSKFTFLRMLKIGGNQLTLLPESLEQLTLLKTLDISENKLTTLPWLGQLTQLEVLDISCNQLSTLPESITLLKRLKVLDLTSNCLKCIPESIGKLEELEFFNLGNNQVEELPKSLKSLRHLKRLGLGYVGAVMEGHEGGNPIGEIPDVIRDCMNLEVLGADDCHLVTVPQWIGNLRMLKRLYLAKNQISDLPPSLASLNLLQDLDLAHNPLDPELEAANKESLDALKHYLRAKTEAQVVLNEAKLILIGEGNVGKSSLLGALRGDPWVDKRPTTHGVEIKPVKVRDSESNKEIDLNAWDFGGQPLYRPTHQLFFTSPAVYLVVWEPRLGADQCCVNEWIKLVRNRAYDETRPGDHPRILIVATHGGPKERRDHIDQEAVRKQFGNLIVGFHQVDSLTAEGIEELKQVIARAASDIRLEAVS